MKNTILMAIGAICGLGGAHLMNRVSHPLNQPYIIYIEKVTDKSITECRKDENCMDILPMSDLPQRKDGAQ